MNGERTKLLTNDSKDNYDSIDIVRTQGASEGRMSPIVFCVHGNKFGMAQCCEELDTRNPVPVRGHCHQDREEGVDKEARKKLIIASVLCVLFMIGEVVGGFLANSLAIATDAAHLLTDFASFMISLIAIYMASKPKSTRMSFGWHRAEVLGAILSVLMIWVVTGVLAYAAYLRVVNQDFEINAVAMVVTSAVGVGVNIIMGCSLHQHGHSHGGGGGAAHPAASDQESGHAHTGGEGHAHGNENINVKAAFIHVIGDFIQSLGVLIAAIVIYFYPEYVIIDPICTFIFGALVLFTTIGILRATISVLMEATPQGFDMTVVKDIFLSVEGIRQVHNLRIWSLTTDKNALAAHLAIEKGHEPQRVLTEATEKIRARYNLYDMTLQVEEYQPEMDGCHQCKDPVQ